MLDIINNYDIRDAVEKDKYEFFSFRSKKILKKKENEVATSNSSVLLWFNRIYGTVLIVSTFKRELNIANIFLKNRENETKRYLRINEI